MALAQVFLGSADILLASLVLYFSLIPFVEIPFDIFIGVFIIAQVLGVFSQVPGGLGVLDFRAERWRQGGSLAADRIALSGTEPFQTGVGPQTETARNRGAEPASSGVFRARIGWSVAL